MPMIRRTYAPAALRTALIALAACLLLGVAPARAQSPKAEGEVPVAALMAAGAIEERALGKADAPVTVVEYASLSCPHCARFHADTLPALKRDFIDTGKVRFVFRDFPFDGVALAGAMIARCTDGVRYFELLDVLFKEQQEWAFSGEPEKALRAIASRYGFTQESFDSCLQNQTLYDGVLAGRQRAHDAFNVRSTPTIFVNGARYSGALSPADLAEAIANAPAQPK